MKYAKKLERLEAFEKKLGIPKKDRASVEYRRHLVAIEKGRDVEYDEGDVAYAIDAQIAYLAIRSIANGA